MEKGKEKQDGKTPIVNFFDGLLNTDEKVLGYYGEIFTLLGILDNIRKKRGSDVSPDTRTLADFLPTYQFPAYHEIRFKGRKYRLMLPMDKEDKLMNVIENQMHYGFMNRDLTLSSILENVRGYTGTWSNSLYAHCMTLLFQYMYNEDQYPSYPYVVHAVWYLSKKD